MKDKKTNKNNIKTDVKDGVEDIKGKSSSKYGILSEILGLIIFIVIAYVIVPRFSFITQEYGLWLPIGLWTTVISTSFNILKRSTKSQNLKSLYTIGNIIPSMYSTYQLIKIYPFDFTGVGFPVMDTILPFALTVAIFGMGVALVINFFKVFSVQKN